jgi:hypothetical protein
MVGGLQGNWAFILLIYAILFAVAIVAHGVWVYCTAADLWRSQMSVGLKGALITLAAVTPIVGFYAVRMWQRTKRGPLDNEPAAGWWRCVMPASGLCAVIYAAVTATMRYTPEGRTLSNVLGFLPGFIAFRVAAQVIVFMAATVSGLSQRGFFASRTHLASAALLFLTAAFA